MLGFDAVGRFALGQIGQAGVSTLTLSAVTGSISVSGIAAVFKYVALNDTGLYAVSGNTVGMNTKISCSAAAFSTSLMSATFRVALSSFPAGYVVVGNNAALGAGGLPAATGLFSVVGYPAFLRIGLTGAAGSYSVYGSASSYTLIRESWFPSPGSSEAWTTNSVDSETWTPANIQSEGWTTIAAP